MEKKSYERPRTEVVLMRVQHHLLDDSPITTTDPDQPADSRKSSSWSEDED